MAKREKKRSLEIMSKAFDLHLLGYGNRTERDIDYTPLNMQFVFALLPYHLSGTLINPCISNPFLSSKASSSYYPLYYIIGLLVQTVQTTKLLPEK